jgi:hypothetical protein
MGEEVEEKGAGRRRKEKSTCRQSDIMIMGSRESSRR